MERILSITPRWHDVRRRRTNKRMIDQAISASGNGNSQIEQYLQPDQTNVIHAAVAPARFGARRALQAASWRAKIFLHYGRFNVETSSF